MSFAMNLIWVVSSSWAHFFLSLNTSEIKLVSSVAQFCFGDNKEREEQWESEVYSEESLGIMKYGKIQTCNIQVWGGWPTWFWVRVYIQY